MFKVENLQYAIGDKKSPSVNLSAPKATVNLITGSNGEGKTLLFRSLIGENKVFKGECSFNGKPLDLAQMPIAFSPVSDFLSYKLRVFDYFNYLFRSGLVKKNELHNLYEVFDFKKHLNTKICKLSDGEKRRFSIIETTIMNRQICFFDEPEANLDENHRAVWLKHLTKLREGKIIFIISHYPEIYHSIAYQNIQINKDKVNYISLNIGESSVC